jgi:hypothetical protein
MTMYMLVEIVRALHQVVCVKDGKKTKKHS